MATISKKKKNTVSKKVFLKQTLILMVITSLKCKICWKYTTQIRTKAILCNLCDQIFDSVMSYVDGITYVHKANVFNHVKAGGLHVGLRKKL